MLVPLPTTMVTVVTATAAVVCTACFGRMDCNPTLWLTDAWMHRSMQNHRQSTGLMGSKFHQRRIWIIGASSGIGEEMAYQLAGCSSSGNSCIGKEKPPKHPHHNLHLILSSRNKEQLERVAGTCRASNPNCTVTVLPMDVCREEDLQSAVRELTTAAQEQDQPLDTVVFNAGGGHLSPALDTSSATALRMLQLNALWPMVLTPLLLSHNNNNDHHDHHRYPPPLFRPLQRPHFVVTTSIAAVLPVPLSATYAAAKHALQGYFESLAAERPDVLIHTVMPGPIDTDFHKNGGGDSSGGGIDEKRNRNNNNNNNDSCGKNTPRSAMKMSVQRCARLICTTMLLSYSTNSWIAKQPVLLALYLQQWCPGLMRRFVYGKLGPQRVAMFRAGLDLYDPASWRKLQALKQQEQQQQSDMSSNEGTHHSAR